jgi:hypothetical protein
MKSVSLSPLDTELQPLLAALPPDSRRAVLEVISRLGSIPTVVRKEVESVIQRSAVRLPPLVQALEATPIAPPSERLGGRTRSHESLIKALCRDDWLPHDFTIPTGAMLGRTVVLARVNFLKSLRYGLEPCLDPSFKELRLKTSRVERGLKPRHAEWLKPLLEKLLDLEENGIFRKLTEELLTYVVANHRNSAALREAAARKLLSIWNNRDDEEVDDFHTVLLSAWKARSRSNTIYGTLFGSDEVLSLIRCECEPRFLSFFTRDQVTPGQTQAFREFLFGLPHEELQLLQSHMSDHGLQVISRDQVHEILGREATYTPPMDSEPTAEEIFASYYRRRIRAEYRALSGRSGPDKTAEGYIMEALLREEFTIDSDD